MKLLEERLPIESITVMIQKEVADRLVTEPGTGDTGAITYAIRYYTNPKRILEVPRDAFLPAPKVNSTVIGLEVLNDYEIVELLHRELNKNTTTKIQDVLKEGGLELYVRGTNKSKKAKEK